MNKKSMALNCFLAISLVSFIFVYGQLVRQRNVFLLHALSIITLPLFIVTNLKHFSNDKIINAFPLSIFDYSNAFLIFKLFHYVSIPSMLLGFLYYQILLSIPDVLFELNRI